MFDLYFHFLSQRTRPPFRPSGAPPGGPLPLCTRMPLTPRPVPHHVFPLFIPPPCVCATSVLAAVMQFLSSFLWLWSSQPTGVCMRQPLAMWQVLLAGVLVGYGQVRQSTGRQGIWREGGIQWGFILLRGVGEHAFVLSVCYAFCSVDADPYYVTWSSIPQYKTASPCTFNKGLRSWYGCRFASFMKYLECGVSRCCCGP